MKGRGLAKEHIDIDNSMMVEGLKKGGTRAGWRWEKAGEQGNRDICNM